MINLPESETINIILFNKINKAPNKELPEGVEYKWLHNGCLHLHFKKDTKAYIYAIETPNEVDVLKSGLGKDTVYIINSSEGHIYDVSDTDYLMF